MKKNLLTLFIFLILIFSSSVIVAIPALQRYDSLKGFMSIAPLIIFAIIPISLLTWFIQKELVKYPQKTLSWFMFKYIPISIILCPLIALSLMYTWFFSVYGSYGSLNEGRRLELGIYTFSALPYAVGVVFLLPILIVFIAGIVRSKSNYLIISSTIYSLFFIVLLFLQYFSG